MFRLTEWRRACLKLMFRLNEWRRACIKLMFRLNEWRRACIKLMTIGWDAATITRRKINEKFLTK